MNLNEGTIQLQHLTHKNCEILKKTILHVIRWNYDSQIQDFVKSEIFIVLLRS